MCGFAGAFNLGTSPVQAGEVELMRAQLTHRGPDDEGLHLSDACGLGFCRLSIIDLEAGHQPVSNEDNSVHAVLNGEIYNYLELRAQLIEQGHVFRTHSDSEVIVHLYEEHGSEFLQHLRGMFAIAIHDSGKQRLLLARDRLGIKPLFYAQTASRLLFGSEIKAIAKHPGFSVAPNIAALRHYLALRFVPGNDTWFAGVSKLPPGHLAVIETGGELRIERFWEIDYNAASPASDRNEALGQFQSAFDDAVQSHLVSDVPVGLFLSGGMDSSSVLAAIAKTGRKDIRCFSADFGVGDGVDETEFARSATQHFGVPHDVLTVPPAQPELLEKIVWHLDEPIGDPAVIPTYLLSMEAAKEVKVVLTGEGSDEINGGYQTYLRYQLFLKHRTLLSAINRAPKFLRNLSLFRGKLEAFGPFLNADSEFELFKITDGFDFADGRIPPPIFPDDGPASSTDAILQNLANSCPSTDPLERLLHFHRNTFMLDDLLPKVDRMTMAHGLEARVPYLDHKLVELTSTFPGSWRVDTEGRRGKSMLRDIMAGVLPENIVERGQHGFNVPLDRWFEKGFRQYLTDILTDKRTLSRGVLTPAAITALAEDKGSQGGMVKSAWMVVMMELWFRQWVD